MVPPGTLPALIDRHVHTAEVGFETNSDGRRRNAATLGGVVLVRLPWILENVGAVMMNVRGAPSYV